MTINTNENPITPDNQQANNHPLDIEVLDFKEQRCQQLHKLSDEHNDCIIFAEKIALIAEQGDESQLAEAIKMVQHYNATELEAHLKHEEQTIFALLVQQHKEHLELCITLGREHGYIRTLVEQMSMESARQDLTDFAFILKQHTLQEELKLFPIVESLFTQEQLDAVVDFVPWQ